MTDNAAADGRRRTPEHGPAGAVPGAARADDGYRGAQVCALVGITYRQLDYWARTGLLRPSIADATGSGSQRRYSYGDVLELKVIKRLLDAGLKLQQARQAVECLRGDLGADLASSQLVLAGSRSVLAQSDGEVVDLLAGGQGVFNVLPALRRGLRTRRRHHGDHDEARRRRVRPATRPPTTWRPPRRPSVDAGRGPHRRQPASPR